MKVRTDQIPIRQPSMRWGAVCAGMTKIGAGMSSEFAAGVEIVQLGQVRVEVEAFLL